MGRLDETVVSGFVRTKDSLRRGSSVLPTTVVVPGLTGSHSGLGEDGADVERIIGGEVCVGKRSVLSGKGVSLPVERRHNNALWVELFCRIVEFSGRLTFRIEEAGVPFLSFSFEFCRLPIRFPRPLTLSLPLSAPLTPPTPGTPSSPRLIVLARIFAIPRFVNVHHGASSSDVSASQLSAEESESYRTRGALRRFAVPAVEVVPAVNGCV